MPDDNVEPTVRIHVINVMASSRDGYIGTRRGETDEERLRNGFLSAEDHEHVEALLAGADAVVLGAESLRFSAGVWLPAAGAQRLRRVIWTVLTRKGIEPSHPFWSDRQVDKLIASGNHGLRADTVAAGGQFLPLHGDSESFASQICSELELRGCKKLILFGGGGVNRLFYNADLVDELYLTLCPFLVGAVDAPRLVDTPLSSPKNFSLASLVASKNHAIFRYRRHKQEQ